MDRKIKNLRKEWDKALRVSILESGIEGKQTSVYDEIREGKTTLEVYNGKVYAAKLGVLYEWSYDVNSWVEVAPASTLATAQYTI